MNEHTALAREAANRLSIAIDELESIANLPVAFEDLIPVPPFAERTRDYRSFWTKAKEISALFKESRLRREDRERLWGRHHELCGRVRELQEREREGKANKSSQTRERILSPVRKAAVITKWAKRIPDLEEARSLLKDALEVMKTEFLLKEHREECWSEWKEANDQIPFKYEDICNLNFDSFGGDINRISNLAVNGDPYEAIEEIKRVQDKIKVTDLTRSHRDRLRDALAVWWNKAMERLNERRRERERKHAEWHARGNEKIDRLESLREKNRGVISRLLDQIDELREKQSTARSADFANLVAGWIREKYEKISDIESTNQELTQKIREIRSNLSGD